jgi:hypothetical protein
MAQPEPMGSEFVGIEKREVIGKCGKYEYGNNIDIHMRLMGDGLPFFS